MLNNFILSFNTVFPLFAVILVGAIINRAGMCSDITKKEGNNIVFKILLPVLIFKNIIYSDFSKNFDLKFMLFNIISILLLFFIVSLFVEKIEKDNVTQGALIHCICRTNSLIYGLSILLNMYDESQIGKALITFAVTVPLNNLISVYTIEKHRGGGVTLGHIISNILKNPVIISTLCAILVRLVGISSFPIFIEKSMDTIAGITTPVALLFLGASVEFTQIKANRRNLIIGVLGKLIVVPAVIVTVAIFIGFSGMDLSILLTVFAAPTAITAYSMSVSMGSNSELTGEIVTFTTVLATITMFLWIFILSQLNVI